MGKPEAKKPTAKKPAAKKPATKPVAKVKVAAKTTPPIVPVVSKPIASADRDELAAPRDVGRLIRYGEKFGAKKIDVRWLQVALPVTSGTLALVDPAVPKSLRVLDRPVGNGQFRAMVAIAKTDTSEAPAALVLHVGRPPIARWTVAHFQGTRKPKDQLPVVVSTGKLQIVDGSSTTGPIELACGAGAYTAYWAVDAADKPIALVVDFDAFTSKEWKAKS